MKSLPKNFNETVLLVGSLLKNYQYAIRGTTSLVLQELDMNVDDIDILCDEKTALTANEIFKDYLVNKVEYSESPQFKSYFGKFDFNGVQVEIMGNWQIKAKNNWSEIFNASDNEKKEIIFQGKKIYVTNIETELKMFTWMQRWSALSKIKKQI
jgi:hypothetical protein